MSMPIVPKQPYRPDLDETVIDLLESIALEEVALSHLLNAEAEKIQAFLCKFHKCDKADYKELISFNRTVNSTLSSIVMKEFLLLRKLETTLQITDEKDCPKKDKKDKHKKKCPPPPCPPGCTCKHCRKE
ncbi:hypothetical protein [Salipaludibacillus aurantiacus]|uniref:Uncharacterized protein n=1 Tax=Salipaludibacillus aurantiacus TaxID=1601833 RepID=A0A1H9UP63_9BACI|nr:hypothetical protein [Salipaludibacillus aurantiacus]SES10907.1 hypothetical protein SAMN05518684_10862 [Salipaludibacillus aurantiacus]